ncbi:MAG: ABC transporter ATP-binding protein [Candidatus Competibacteraceae bacterium]
MLQVRHLQRPGLYPVSFELNDGECIAVQGPSGSGKSLLLRAIADLDPNQGEVWLNGLAREGMTGPAWRRQVIYVPAESGWWSDRVGEHFADWDRAIPLLQALFLPADARDWPVQRLSTGERQRMALVRALVLEPRVLLLDEPTSGLDSDTTAAAEQLIGERLRNGAGVLWVTHSATQARRIASRCLSVESGRVRDTLL